MSIHINKKRKEYFICYQAQQLDGKYKTISITNCEWKTSKVGKKYMTQIEQDEIDKDRKKRAIFNHSKNDSLSNIIEDYIQENYSTKAEQTAYGKKLGVEKWVVPYFNSKLDVDKAITLSSLEKWRKTIIDQSLSPNRINGILRYMREIISFASDHDFISYELERKLTRVLKGVKECKTKTNVLKYWTVEEWDKFISTFNDDDPFRLFFMVEYMAALRLGEILPLQWKDFDSDNNRIIICKAENNQGTISYTKNESSNAPVTIPKSLTQELIKFKKDCCATDDDFIFFAWKKTSRTTVRRKMDEHIEMANVPPLSPHGLRHSSATRLFSQGVPVNVVSQHLRHASVKETLDTYIHIIPSQTQGLMDKIFG